MNEAERLAEVERQKKIDELGTAALDMAQAFMTGKAGIEVTWNHDVARGFTIRLVMDRQ